jgi:hypothetical protein
MFSMNKTVSLICVTVLPVAVAAAVVLWSSNTAHLPPLHASCSVDWTFQRSCADINKAIADQMKKWESDENCKSGGEKCLYKLKTQTLTEITGTHETPKKHYIDDLSFTFRQDGDVCSVHGYSTSETWYAVLDYGTNYCNLHNLITGSSIDTSPGYSETTSNAKCTQYSSADCEIY